jgi:hypothetical protein
MPRSCSLLLFAVCLTAPAAAQQPLYAVDPAARPSGALQTTLIARPGSSFAALLDGDGGPTRFLGETFYLRLGPGLLAFDAGAIGASGVHTRTLQVPIAMAINVPVYLQAVVLDNGAPNGLFWTTDGESAVVVRSLGVFVEKLVDARAQGYTGDYDRAQLGRLQAAAVRVRTQRTVPDGGVLFASPVIGPLNPFGVRTQLVLRARELGAIGEEEIVTAIRWRPLNAVAQDAFADLSLELAHSTVVPDFAIDPFSALPRFPNSGLSRTFASNVKQGESLVQIYRGPYLILPGDQRADGYLPYPAPQRLFVYNGVDSLLLDFKMTPSNASGRNGHAAYLMVQSSPRPDARAFDGGTATNPVNPHASVLAQNGDNTELDLQIELAKVASIAISPWRDSGVAAPDYHAPVLARSVPAGATLDVEYRGSASPDGASPTPWSASIDGIDGLRYLQMRVTMRAALGGAVPSLDAIVIPLN